MAQAKTLDRLDSVLRGRLVVGLREYAELEGVSLAAARMRAYRGTLGVPIVQQGPHAARRILSDDLRRRYCQS